MNSQNETVALATALMQSRQTILPKRLLEPGPDAQQFQLLLEAAASAPDHGQLLPWRFVLVPQNARGRLAAVFVAALQQRDSRASAEQLALAGEKAYRAPLLLLVVVDAEKGDASIPLQERIISAGCAIQNILLMAAAMGFGSALTSGKALGADQLRTLFGLSPSEQALCFISVGTAASQKPARLRPVPGDFLSGLPSA